MCVFPQFTTFNTEQDYDIVDVYVGSPVAEEAVYVGSFSGNLGNTINEISSNNNYMFIKFTSDSATQSTNGKGFQATWKIG